MPYEAGTRPGWLQDNAEDIRIVDTMGQVHDLKVGAVSWGWVRKIQRKFNLPAYTSWLSGPCPAYPGTKVEAVRHDGTVTRGLSEAIPASGEGRLTFVGFRVL